MCACVVYADLRAPNLSDTLSRHLRHPLTRGVRQEVWCDPASTRADIPREDILADPRWQEDYRMLAEHELSFDLVAWPTQLPQFAAIAADGPRRCMIGSNFPVERLAGGFAEVYQIMIASLGLLSEPDRAQVLAETSRRFYRTGAVIDAPPPAPPAPSPRRQG